MTHDAFDPGIDGSYPYFPRLTNGAPAWSDTPATDGVKVPGRGPDGEVTPMPRGNRIQITGAGVSVLVDMTPRNTDGSVIEPPVLEDAPP